MLRCAQHDNVCGHDRVGGRDNVRQHDNVRGRDRMVLLGNKGYHFRCFIREKNSVGFMKTIGITCLDGHPFGGRRATIKAHPATPHHPRPYGMGGVVQLEGWKATCFAASQYLDDYSIV
jgi:hypothetical protein